MPDDLEEMLDTIEAEEDSLTDDERQFIDECQERLGNFARLAEWRTDKIENIYKRISNGNRS